MKSLLITGASGFVGKHALEHATCHYLDTSIWAMTRKKDPDMQRAFPQVRWLEVDMLDGDKLDAAIREIQPNTILHLAAASSVGYSWQHPRLSILNNLNIFLNLLEAVRHYAPKARILSVGSSDVYGQVEGALLPLKEDAVIHPASPYGVSRASQEALSKVYVDGFGLDIVISRSFNHFGPGQDSRFVMPSFAKQIAAAKNRNETACHLKTGNIDIVRDFSDVRDTVNAYFHLLNSGKSGEIYNICSGKGRSLREVIQTMADMVGIEVTIEIDPELVRPQDLLVIYGDNSKIKHDISWTPQIEFTTTVQNVMDEWLSRESAL